MRRAILLLLVVAVACVAPRAPRSAAPDRAQQQQQQQLPFDLHELLGALRREPRLDAVAMRAAVTAARDHVVSEAAVRDAMIAELATDLMPYALVARGDDGAVAAQLTMAMAELGAAAELEAGGVATATGATGRVVAIVAAPAPRVPATVTREGDHARIAIAWRGPGPLTAFAVLPDRSRRLTADVRADGVEIVLACMTHPGATVELDAGTRLIASVVGACGAPPPVTRGPLEIGPPARTPAEFEQRLFELMVRERVGLGRVPLAWDPAAQRVARAHAADMAQRGYIGHVGRGGDTLNDRVVGAALPAVETFENVGHASGPGAVHYAFLASPGHRANLLAAAATRGAVGVALDPREPSAFYVTALLYQPSPAR